jgi:ABC-type transport system involved in cytochrome c biogenesis permease subunit
MEIKYTMQGALIYATLSCFALTALAANFRSHARVFWWIGFITALFGLIYRALVSGHAPMQNLFEFFLCMAAVFAPVTLLTSRRYGLDTLRQDAILGCVVMFPAGFVFSEALRPLPPALQSPFFVPHVGSYIAAYVLLARATLMAWPLRKKFDTMRFAAVRESVAVGFVLLTAGLLLGSVWGQYCWGTYWAWDPKELWSLATWFVYAASFHLWKRPASEQRKLVFPMLALGLTMIVLTLTWINLSRIFSGMHNYA